MRSFNEHHCQVPVTDGTGKLSSELSGWLPFLDQTFALWLQGTQNERDLLVVPKIGPVQGGYNLAKLSKNWENAKVFRPIIAKSRKNAPAVRSSKNRQ